MPLSDADTTTEVSQPGFGIAVAAEVLYLTNLLLVPGLAFLVLIWLYLRDRQTAPPLGRCHLVQTVSASIWAGVMLVVVNLLIILLGGYDSPNTWMIVIIYFTTVHATLVLLGTLGLARAMAGKHYHYPLVGRPCQESQ
jgi:uncharacterized Tic20 family protein